MADIDEDFCRRVSEVVTSDALDEDEYAVSK